MLTIAVVIIAIIMILANFELILALSNFELILALAVLAGMLGWLLVWLLLRQ